MHVQNIHGSLQPQYSKAFALSGYTQTTQFPWPNSMKHLSFIILLFYAISIPSFCQKNYINQKIMGKKVLSLFLCLITR